VNESERFTYWIERARDGDADASAQLWESVYQQVRGLAQQAIAREFRPGSLAATELANEVYLRLAGGAPLPFESRTHLLATVARAIRRLLVDRSRAKHTTKRGGGSQRVEWEEQFAALEPDSAELIDLDWALEALDRFEPRYARLVELRFFGGLTLDEAADALGISRRTVANQWAIARAWLRRKLGEDSE
jgi:RNA polymerase sigma factor (TIGR02999 family)